MKRWLNPILVGTAVVVVVFIVLGRMAITHSDYVPETGPAKNSGTVVDGVYEPRRFGDGEVCEYEIRGKKGPFIVPVGKCTFTARRIDLNGTAAWQFTLKGAAFLGLVSYDATSVVNGEFNHTITYHTVQEDLSSRTVDLEFDQAEQVCRRSLNGSPAGWVPTEAHTLDPLSIIYKFREMNLAQPGEFSSAVSDGKATFKAKVRVVGRQDITIGNRKFPAILVEPDLGDMRGIFRKTENAKLQIWLSADAHQTALRIRTEIKHGTFIADLKNYKRPK